MNHSEQESEIKPAWCLPTPAAGELIFGGSDPQDVLKTLGKEAWHFIAQDHFASLSADDQEKIAHVANLWSGHVKTYLISLEDTHGIPPSSV